MGDIFVRRTTIFLLSVIFVLSILSVALLVIVFGPSKSTPLPPENKVFIVKQPPPSYSGQSDYPGHDAHPVVPIQVEESSKVTSSPELLQTKLEPWEKNVRLPKTTIPYHYELLLHPHLQDEFFEGHVSITIGVTNSMDYLLTHMKLLNITSTTLLDSSGESVGIKEAFEYMTNEYWVVLPEKTLAPGNYTLSISFNGPLKGHIVGFYMSEYLTKSGERRSIASSKFQPTDARRAFPCFDEPSFKSTFKTTLVRPSEGYTALSNMPVEKEIADSPKTGLTTVVFEKSVPMVTYLACFIVCDFEYVEVMTEDNKPFRVYSTPDQVDRATYARDIGVNILNYFEKYFEVKFPLPKLDMIAIPEYVSGATEHWGLITYRETNLLYDEVNSSSYNKRRVAAVVSHELAHMWFGNLVTLEWWDDLWLNEGFASYIQYKGVANYEKDWDMLDQFLILDLHSVFKLDQILSSHPIVQPVNHPDEITEIFDKISYSKGASVLRMLEAFMGSENFRIGVRNFLNRYKFANAVTQDLWNELQATLTNDLNITRVMDTWTRQMGFPVLNVKKSMTDKNKLEVRQQRFLVDPDAQSDVDSPFYYKWDVPITYATNNMKPKQIWLNMDQEKVMLDRPEDSEWVKLNVDQYGYYRVNYDQDMWTELTDALRTNHQAFSPSDRANLIDDSFTLAAAGQLSYNVAFQIISYIPQETHYVPWSATRDHLNELGDLLQDTKAYAYFRKYVIRLVDKHVERVGWEDTGSLIERRNREGILHFACKNGHVRCIEGAVDKFRAWINDSSNAIPAEFRNLAYMYGIQETGENEWNTLLDRFRTEVNAQEKLKMLRGLTSTKEAWIVKRFLSFGKNETIIKQQDYFTMLSYFAYNPSALPHVWDYVRGNWKWMVEKFGLNNRYLGRLPKTISSHFTSPLKLKELTAFYEENPEAGSGKRARIQAVENIKQNIKWIETYSKPLYMWLEKNTI